VCHVVESDAYAELGGLVVDESQRRKGVAGKLMEAVENWARQQGCSVISARSNIIRHEAHKFYASRGFKKIKTQYTFRKRL
jgi:GNAT superfamily N-acetyltransferase